MMNISSGSTHLLVKIHVSWKHKKTAYSVQLRTLYIFLVLYSMLLVGIPLHAAEDKEALLNDFWVFTTTSPSLVDTENKIEQYEKQYQDDLYIYTQVIITKIDILSEYMKKRDIVGELSVLDQRWQAHAKSAQLSSAEYSMWAALKSSRLRYLSIKQIITESKLVEQYYKKAIRIDKNNAKAYIGLGISAIFTPKVAGGGLSKAVKFLEKGISISQYNHDLYLGNIWLSQVYLKMGKTEEYQESWQKAEGIFGETPFLQIVAEQNQEGKILGE